MSNAAAVDDTLAMNPFHFTTVDCISCKKRGGVNEHWVENFFPPTSDLVCLSKIDSFVAAAGVEKIEELYWTVRFVH